MLYSKGEGAGLRSYGFSYPSYVFLRIPLPNQGTVLSSLTSFTSVSRASQYNAVSLHRTPSFCLASLVTSRYNMHGKTRSTGGTVTPVYEAMTVPRM